jgi:hypothetical protein
MAVTRSLYNSSLTDSDNWVFFFNFPFSAFIFAGVRVHTMINYVIAGFFYPCASHDLLHIINYVHKGFINTLSFSLFRKFVIYVSR